jgi:hypothetical protein
MRRSEPDLVRERLHQKDQPTLTSRRLLRRGFLKRNDPDVARFMRPWAAWTGGWLDTMSSIAETGAETISEAMLWRTRPGRSTRAPRVFSDPCLSTVAAKPPAGPRLGARDQARRLPPADPQARRPGPTVHPYRRRLDRAPWIVEDVARLKPKALIIDAEAVCAGKDGVTDFDALHTRCREDQVFAYGYWPVSTPSGLISNLNEP